ncbi:MAG: GNAT family N-acetyltransferase [Motilibacteraceae bacterium]
MTDAEPIIRAREPEDLPALAAALLAQQPETRYPFRNPLPIPAERFLHAEDAAAAWTAEVDGQPAGHVCRVGPAHGFPEAEVLIEKCAQAHGCEPAQLAWVSSLFLAREARGLGLGRRLLATVVEDIRANGLQPCLEVLPVHAAAFSLYRAGGWTTVHRFRPAWLGGAPADEVPDVHVMVLTDSSGRG